MSAYSLPKFADWQTYGGGTASPGRYSYHAPVAGSQLSEHGSPGAYIIDPVASERGRHLGYRVLFCDAGGDLVSRGLQGGLYAELVAQPLPLPAARRAVQEHFRQTYGRLEAEHAAAVERYGTDGGQPTA